MAKQGKRFLSWPFTLTFMRLGLQSYRNFVFGGFLFGHENRLRKFLHSREPAIFAAWHQDFVFTLGYLSRWNTQRKTYALASESRDGGMAATAARAVGYRQPVRGSSARGGSKALLALTRLLRREPEASVVIVCDGPRPPARQLKPGILSLARSTGRPIWLVRTSFERRAELSRTWARFHIPMPWSRGVCLADGPIYVPEDISREDLETLRVELEARLNVLAEQADARVARTH